MGVRSRCQLAEVFALLCTAASLPAAPKDDIVRFQSEVSRGHDFREPIGHGLVLIFASTGDGWEIRVAPQTVTDRECEDFSWVVNLPVRSYNALHLNPSYGVTAKEAVGMSPRDFNFVLTCAGYKRESTYMRLLTGSLPIGAVPPSEKYIAEAEKKLGTSPQGHGKLWIEQYRISAAPESVEGKNYGQIDWIRFRVEIRFPENAGARSVPNDFVEPDTRPRRTVTGTVRDAFTRLLVEGAQISLTGQGAPVGEHASVITDTKGRFRFEDIPEGPVNILVKKPGFFPITSGSSVPYSPPDSLFTVGSGANDFDIDLTHASSIIGHVVDGDGHALEAVFVHLTVNELSNGRKSWHWLFGQAVTTKDGAFSFGNLRPGQYVVHTLLQPIASGPEPLPVEAYLPRHYPNAGDFASADGLDLRGQELRADFMLSRGRIFSVSGSVGGLLNPYSFHCQFADAAGQVMTVTGWQYNPDTAQFVILMPAGLWTLWSDGSDGPKHAYATREIKVESANITGLQLEVRQPFDIPTNENVARLSRIDPPIGGLAPEPD